MQKYLKVSIGYLVLFSLFALTLKSTAQTNEPSFVATTDKNKMVIGDQIKLTLISSYNHQDHIAITPIITDTFNTFQIVNKPKVDTIIENNNTTIKQYFYLTCFDSGSHYIPSFSSDFKSKKGGSSLTLTSNPISINVTLPIVDTTKPPMPIFDIQEAKMPTWLLIMYVAVALLTLLILYVLYIKYLKHKKSKSKVITSTKIAIPPYTIAIQKLEQIKQQQDWLNDKEKKYHTELTDVLREYFNGEFKIDTFEKTSDEIIAICEKSTILKKYISDITYVLTISDMVKFAKGKPQEDEHTSCLSKIKKVIQDSYQIHQQQEEIKLQTLKKHEKK